MKDKTVTECTTCIYMYMYTLSPGVAGGKRQGLVSAARAVRRRVLFSWPAVVCLSPAAHWTAPQYTVSREMGGGKMFNDFHK